LQAGGHRFDPGTLHYSVEPAAMDGYRLAVTFLPAISPRVVYQFQPSVENGG
jgi:hypothetical protein